jgi:glycosyltransferase involved in cell wall biosynthesis
VIRRRLANALDRRFEALHHRMERLEEELRLTRERLDHELYPTLRILAGRDSESRRLLAAARAADDYRLAWDNPNPLVTVIVPTVGRPELLRSRVLPAVLGQTHQRLEVLVVGDGPNAEAEAVVREAADPRLRWTSTPQRYVYPDEYRHWLAATTLARNEGYRLAEGRWLFDVDDDDSLPADAIESLLAAARATRAEAVQGLIATHTPDGSTERVRPALPDRLPLKGALVHAHLRFFEREHVASALAVPGDWFRGERMLRAGVRIELLDRVTYDYYPSSLWATQG